jgi:hypothetical protein
MRLGCLRSLRRVSAPALGLAIVGASLLSFMPAQAQTPTPPKFLNVKGYAVGMDEHTTLLRSGNTNLAETEVGYGGAVVDGTSAGLGKPILNEYSGNVSCPPLKDDPKACAPATAAKHSFAHGSGIEVGLGTTVPSGADPNQIILAAKASASAPKSSHDRQEIGPVPGDPIAWASATRGDATANWNSSGLVPGVCVIGDDISRGIGYVADAQLLDAGAAKADGSMSSPVVSTDYTQLDDVSQTTSREFLVPNAGHPNNFGLRSQVVQTIAPVSLLKTPDPQTGVTSVLTLKFLGQWVLDVTATGHSGTAAVHYGPGKVSPETPILQVFNGGTLAGQLLFQDLFGTTGQDINIPGLVDITLGEAPRALAKAGQPPVFGSKPKIAADGTSVSAAVDVARIQILGGIQGAGTLTVGHMETSAQVPSGGISCPVPVTKAVNPDKIHIGAQPDTARVTFNVLNPYDCDLTNVTLTDAIRQKVGDPDFILLSSDPTADSPSMPTSPLKTADVSWSLGTIKQGQHKVVTMDVKSSKNGGVLRDIATASGKLANCKGAGVGGLAIGTLGIGQLTLTGVSPAVDINIELARTGPDSRRTAAVGGGIAAIAAAGAFTLRRRRRA